MRFVCAEAPCGRGTNTFDVVEIGPLVVPGLCGCLSASDTTDDDADAPEVETMETTWSDLIATVKCHTSGSL